MNLKPMGWARTIRGLREGDQSLVVTGLALVLIQYLRSSKPNKQLIYRKELPVDSTIVVRHTRRGDPKLQINRP